MTNKTGYENLLKVLRKHIDHCKMHEFSLQEKRHCTCGVEEAREFVSELTELFYEMGDNPLFGLTIYGHERIDGFEEKWLGKHRVL